jgi:hypothetical protein
MVSFQSAPTHKSFYATDLDETYNYPSKRLLRHFEKALKLHFSHKPFKTWVLDEAYSYPSKRLLRNMEIIIPAQMLLKIGTGKAFNIDMPPPRLFEIGRSRPIPLPIDGDLVLLKHEEV